MSSFFSLGGVGGSGSGGGRGDSGKEQAQQPQDQHDTTANNLLLFKNEEIYNKGFELWQQYCQLHQQRLHQIQDHHRHVDFDIGPSNSSRNSDDRYQNHHQQQQQQQQTITRAMRSSSLSSSSSGMNCQDCGNQAKKDCSHLRCRTCCKSRGFVCETHVKSTWVPAAKRRERQQQLTSLQQQQQNQQQLRELSLRGEVTKRAREINLGGGGGGGSSSSALVCTRLTATSSGLEMGHFPAELNSPAIFRCVRMSAIDDAEEQLAYQTAVNIGGHVFKGILYDQGPDSRFHSGGGGGGEGSSGSGSGAHHHNQQQQQPLNLITGPVTTTTTTGVAMIAATTAANQGVTMLDPSMYPTPLSAFMAGTQFFPPPRP